VAAAIAITGVGQVSALGAGMAALRAGIAAGRCGIGPLTLFAHHGRSAVAAQVEAPVAASGEARRLSRSDRLALAAADEACRAAGLEAGVRADAGLAVGTTTGGMRETEEAYRQWRASEHRHARPSGFVGMPLSTVGAAVAQRLGLLGPRVTVSTACCRARSRSRRPPTIRRGERRWRSPSARRRALPAHHAGFDAPGARPEPCRPFAARRVCRS
jgi:3-oxoacyl-[acyl-carrier-protein] synthase II